MIWRLEKTRRDAPRDAVTIEALRFDDALIDDESLATIVLATLGYELVPAIDEEVERRRSANEPS